STGDDFKNAEAKPASSHAAGERKSGSPTITCQFCHKRGHTKDQCFLLHRKKKEAANKDVVVEVVEVKDQSSFTSYIHPDDTDVQAFPTSVDDGDHSDRGNIISEPEKVASDPTPASSTQVSSKRQDKIAPERVIEGPLKVPIILNGIRTYGLIDSGASHSCISTDFRDQLDEPLIQVDGKITSATGVSLRIGKMNLKLEYGDQSFFHDFEILPITTTTVLIGRDLFPQLGITISGLITTWPGPKRVNTMDLDDEKLVAEDPNGWIPLSGKDQATIADGIQDLLDANKSTKWFCSYPYAKIPIKTGKHAPIYRRQYEVAEALKSAVSKKIKELLERGIVRYSSPRCPWNMPLLCAPKKDENGNKVGIRVCLDTRALNQIIPEDTYKVPLIRDIFKRVAGFACASLIDLKEGYHQFLLEEDDAEKTTFEWDGHRYCFVGGPYGLKNIPGLFQRIMSDILSEFSDFCCVYIDDILIWSRSVTEHIHHLRLILAKLNSLDLTINVQKSHFGFKQILVLGHLYDGHVLRSDPKKISAFANLQQPTTGKQVESLLGAANYLRDFIPLYSTICAPLEKLRKLKTIGSSWSDEAQRSFDMLKKVLSSAPVLTAPDLSLPFKVSTDASKYGIGAVLYQEPNEGKRKFVAFASSALTSGQRNYSTTRREMLAIIFALKKFRSYLYGRPFTLFTDHRALTYLLTQKHDNSLLNYWAETIFEFDMKIEHRPGVEMLLEDSLSRLFYEFRSKTKGQSAPCVFNISVGKELKEFIRERFDKTEVTDPKIQHQLIEEAHAHGHFGAQYVFKDLFKKGFYWKTMYRDIKDYIGQCKPCLQFSVMHEGFHPLVPMEASKPMQTVSIDTLGPLPTSNGGYNYILVALDLFSRFVILSPLISKSADDVAQSLLTTFSRFGFPSTLISDNGSEFKNKVVKGIAQLSDFTQKFSLPYNPRVNGSAENAVKMTKGILFKMALGDLSEWDKLLPFVQIFLNNRLSKRHQSSPFHIMFGRESTYSIGTAIEVEHEPSDEEIQKWKDQLTLLGSTIYPGIQAATVQSNDRMKRSHDKARKIIEPIPIGTRVMVKKAIREAGHIPLFTGPFMVVKRSGNSYVLTDPTGALYPTKIPIHRLKRLEDVESPDTPSFEVEKILKHRGDGKNREYFVKWTGYSADHNSWVKVADFNENDIIRKYHMEKRKK
ncbi:MAG: RNase H-like domain-containing protein, partial [Candidatus Paceibacterota bacterium]